MSREILPQPGQSEATGPRAGIVGGVRAEIVDVSIDPQALLADSANHGDGAQAVFIGVVRNHAEGRPVRGMRYEAYEPMARQVLHQICTEAREQHGVTSVQAVHRIGELALGEASVAIVVGSPHRGPCYEASRYVIEEIKKRLPVWKHEHFTDGEARWVPGTALAPDGDAPRTVDPGPTETALAGEGTAGAVARDGTP